MHHGPALVVQLQQQLAASKQRVQELEKRWEPIEEKVRTTFELESMPVLLNGGTKGQERLAQLLVSWHTTETERDQLQATVTAQQDEIDRLQDELEWGLRDSYTEDNHP